MATTVVTKATGATTRPVGVLYVEPELQVLDAGAGSALEGSGLDPAFTADLLSAWQYREVVNAGGVPSEQVIDSNRERAGRDYRDETEGENPVPALRA